jgi:hypothetical protein
LIGGGLVVIVLVLAWISLPFLFGGGMQGCTLIGCWNSLDVAMEAAGVDPGTYEADVCFDGTCQTVEVTVTVDATGAARFTAEGLDGSPRDDRPTEVSVRLLQSGVMVAERSGPVLFRTSRPNGPRCDPVCFTGSLVV